MRIREITVDDAEKFLDLCKKLDTETKFMLFEPGERVVAIEEQRKRIRFILNSKNQMIHVAEDAGELIGFVSSIGRPIKRKSHDVYIHMGILKSYTHQGIGKRLLETVDKWALKNKVHRLGGTVLVHNETAIGLYKKMGFKIEGRMKDSVFIDGTYLDEYIMAKTLE